MEKKKYNKGLIIGLSVVVLAIVSLVIYGIYSYNNMVSMKSNIDESYSNMDVQLQRRNDLIPNLVETVKGFASHEKDAIESVTNARAAMMGAKTVEESGVASGGVTTALGRLFSITENYPDLKANQNFIALQDQLEGTENRISQQRLKYNETVKEYNKKIKQFPASVIAGMFGYEASPYFEVVPGSENPPNVSFS